MKADKKMLTYIGAKPGSPSRDSDSGFAPSYYTGIARNVMSSIDLDPFSSSKANKVVKAKSFFDIESNAFDRKSFYRNNRKGTVLVI